MAFLIYKKSTGALVQISSISDVWTAEDTIKAVFGVNGNNTFGAVEWDADFPVGKKVVNGSVVDDPAYVPPPTTTPPEPTTTPTP